MPAFLNYKELWVFTCKFLEKYDYFVRMCYNIIVGDDSK